MRVRKLLFAQSLPAMVLGFAFGGALQGLREENLSHPDQVVIPSCFR